MKLGLLLWLLFLHWVFFHTVSIHSRLSFLFPPFQLKICGLLIFGQQTEKMQKAFLFLSLQKLKLALVLRLEPLPLVQMWYFVYSFWFHLSYTKSQTFSFFNVSMQYLDEKTCQSIQISIWHDFLNFRSLVFNEFRISFGKSFAPNLKFSCRSSSFANSLVQHQEITPD